MNTKLGKASCAFGDGRYVGDAQRSPDAVVGNVACLDRQQSLRLMVRQRSEEHGVHDTEHGGVRADRNGERCHRDHGERRGAPQHAQRDAEVTSDGIHHLPEPDAARAMARRCVKELASLVQRSEATLGLTACVVGSESVADELFDPKLQVQPDLLTRITAHEVIRWGCLEPEKAPDAWPDVERHRQAGSASVRMPVTVCA